MAPQAIQPAPVAEPGYSLIIAAPPVPDDGAVWQEGVRWQPLGGCSGAHGLLPIECNGDTDAMDEGPRQPVRTELPMVLWAADTCSVHGGLNQGRQERARQALLGSQSFDLASELWTGTEMDAAGNNYLSHPDSDTVTDGPTSVTGVLGQLVGALGARLGGRRGMIHVTPQLLVHLAAVGAIYQAGNLWYTPMGHLVVADAGYDGSGPGGVPATTSQWAYATDMVSVRLSEVVFNPPSPDSTEGMAMGVDRSDNSYTVYAMRLALLQWDGCAQFAGEVDLAVPLVAGAS